MASAPIAALLAKRGLPAPTPEASSSQSDKIVARESEAATQEPEETAPEEPLEYGLDAFAGLRQSSSSSSSRRSDGPGGGGFERESSSRVTGIDLRSFASAEELLQAEGGEALKAELQRLGLKCGGTPEQRAERLWLTKGVRLAELEKAQPSLFAKPGKKATTAAAAAAASGSLFRPSLGPLLPGVERRVGQKSVRSTAAGLDALAQHHQRLASRGHEEPARPAKSMRERERESNAFVAEQFRTDSGHLR